MQTTLICFILIMHQLFLHWETRIIIFVSFQISVPPMWTKYCAMGYSRCLEYIMKQKTQIFATLGKLPIVRDLIKNKHKQKTVLYLWRSYSKQIWIQQKANEWNSVLSECVTGLQVVLICKLRCWERHKSLEEAT